jgi:SAM-dependent methyltransferase
MAQEIDPKLAIETLYQAVLNRPSDTLGFAAIYDAHINKGMSLNQIFKAFQESPEYCALYPKQGGGKFDEHYPCDSFGCQVVASDLQAESEMSKYWASASQWCSGLEAINERKICEDGAFRSLVSYRHVDMNHIPEDLVNFDFNWSSCSFEHLGSIELGLRFLKNQLQTLKPGGWAVHTTEYNISSNDDTLEEPNCVIFRQRDIDKIVAELRAEGHYVEELDYSLGWFPLDYKVDLPPYNGGPHLRLLVSNYICTSIGLIIRKKM